MIKFEMDRRILEEVAKGASHLDDDMHGGSRMGNRAHSFLPHYPSFPLNVFYLQGQ